MKPSLASRILIAAILAVLPGWTVWNRAEGLVHTQDWVLSRALRGEMRNLGAQQLIYRSDTRRFGTLAELEAAGIPATVALSGMGPMTRTSVTLFGESVGADSYSISATLDELPWVRGTVTVTQDEQIDFASSVDWIEEAGRFDLFEITVTLLGVALAALAFVVSARGPRWRNAFGWLAAVVVGVWLLSLSYQPLVPSFTARAGPVLGDSTWTFM